MVGEKIFCRGSLGRFSVSSFRPFALVRLDAFSFPQSVIRPFLFRRLPVWLLRSLFVEAGVVTVREQVGAA